MNNSVGLEDGTSVAPPPVEIMESDLPVCSVCIANYNGIDLIDACINSVLAQDCPFKIEIIVHDDASTDGSADYIRIHHPQATLLMGAENVGFCVSNNRMVAAAKGQFVLLLNNDAELFPDALRTLFSAAMALPKPAILGLPQYDAQTDTLIDIGSKFDLFLNPVPNLDPSEHDVGMIIGACLWLPRVLWNELGGFPAWFESVAEDTYLCCVARLCGYTVMALPQSGFRHWVGKSLGGGKIIEKRLSTKATRRAISERNKNYVMTLVFPSPIFQLIIFLHILLLLLEGCTLALTKFDSNILMSIYIASIKSLWIRRKALRRERIKIQAMRRISRKKFFSVFQRTPHKLELLIKYGVPKIQ